MQGVRRKEPNELRERLKVYNSRSQISQKVARQTKANQRFSLS